jgi:hypothetical protein
MLQKVSYIGFDHIGHHDVMARRGLHRRQVGLWSSHGGRGLALLAAWTLVLGCGQQASNSRIEKPTTQQQAVNASTYVPLSSPSMLLEYHINYQAFKIRTGEAKAVVRTVESRVIDGNSYVGQEFALSGTPIDFTQVTLFRATPAGIMCRMPTSAKESLYLPEKIEIGSEWDTSDAHCKCLGIEDVSCNDIVYRNCLKIGLGPPGSPPQVYRWYAPSVGIVKFDQEGTLLSLQATLRRREP